MCRKKCDVATVKEWLMDYRNNERDLDNQIERLQRLVSKMEGVGAQIMTDMPRSNDSSNDRMADYFNRREEIETSIEGTIESQKNTRQQIEGILQHIHRPDERAVIRMRYLDVSNWYEVVEMMFGAKDDFDSKEETYRRRVLKIHGTALIHMAQYIEENMLFDLVNSR